MLSRRASLDWNLETIGKLIIGVAILIGIAWMTVKMIGLFTGGAADWRVGRNLELLNAKIAETKSTGQETSVIISLPNKRILIGFVPNQADITFDKSSLDKTFATYNQLVIKRPKECAIGDTCVCALNTQVSKQTFEQDQARKADVEEYGVVACKKVPYVGVVGTRNEMPGIATYLTVKVPKVSLPNSLLGAGQVFIISGDAPADIRIIPSPTYLMLDAGSVTPTSETAPSSPQ